MKAFMILGAIGGFLIGVSFGLLNGSSWPAILWHTAAAALVMALLARWWSHVWFQGLRDSVEQRRRAPILPPANLKPTQKI
jgi:hypothetical protein